MDIEIKKYKVITTQELLNLSQEMRRNSRISIYKDKAIVIYDEEVEEGMNITEIKNYMDNNLNDWHVSDITQIIYKKWQQQ